MRATVIFLSPHICFQRLAVGGFLWVLRFPTPIKTNCHNIIEILLKVVFNTITLALTQKD
jgi:hypothetical protein